MLLQTTKNKTSRTFLDYEKTSLAVEGIVSLFEKRLKVVAFPPATPTVCPYTTDTFFYWYQEMYPNMRRLDYDVSDLYNYIDALSDLSALVYDPAINAYAPQNKEWVKQKCLAHLKKQAGGR